MLFCPVSIDRKDGNIEVENGVGTYFASGFEKEDIPGSIPTYI